MTDEVRIVLRLAFLSRVLILFLQVIFNFLVNDYDSSSTIVRNTTKSLDKAVIFIFDGFQKWDSVYFLQIAKDGYQYEQYMAFFPLYPWLVRAISLPIHMVLGKFISIGSILLVVGWMVSCACFSLAAVFLYKLSLQVMKDKCLAFNSSVLFCINPANVFMSSVYTESVFACCLFSGLYCLEKSNSVMNILASSLVLCLGSASRSNGIVSCGFVLHKLLKTLMSDIFTQVTPIPRLRPTWKSAVYALLITMFKVIVSMVIILLPLVAFQLYGYFLFCLKTGPSTPPWCSWKLPLSYSYIQNHYWNVGFLKYFEVKQIPNFILALPMVVLSLMAVWEFIGDNSNRLTVKTLGLWQPTNNKSSTESRRGFHSADVFVYIAHLIFLTLFGLTSIHVQVLTRLIASSSPFIYWYTSHFIVNKPSMEAQVSYTKDSLVLGYFVTYTCIGVVLHCNFYPWT
ncbi:GPI mannosyltransferase 2-like [Actinia tenebrosa]|uniref:GPI mannosyltransferase 2 n=1 Tax=Actinia tenebrosa TaxID=6105 RepID=A0A6P8J703_ACTTE|nr:GPI mannosyltransferase 2-like [Actinia tenebrosa]